MTAEEVTRVPAGLDEQGRMTYGTVWQGRPARPGSVAEWCAQRVAAMGLVGRALPGCRAVAELLGAAGAGGDFDAKAAVRAAGKPLDEMARYGVRIELERLAEMAQRDYPPAAPAVRRLREAWARQWGEREPRQRREPLVPVPAARPRTPALYETGADPDRLLASWQRYGDALAAAWPAAAGA